MKKKNLRIFLILCAATAPSYGDKEEVQRLTQDFNEYFNTASQNRKKLTQDTQEKELEATAETIKKLMKELEKMLPLDVTSNTSKNLQVLEKDLKDLIKQKQVWVQSKANQFITLNRGNFDALYHKIVQDYLQLKPFKKNINIHVFKDAMSTKTKAALEQSKFIELLNEGINDLKNKGSTQENLVSALYLNARATLLQSIKDKIFDFLMERVDMLYRVKKDKETLQGDNEAVQKKLQDAVHKTLRDELTTRIDPLEKEQSRVSPETLKKLGYKTEAQDKQRLHEIIESENWTPKQRLLVPTESLTSLRDEIGSQTMDIISMAFNSQRMYSFRMPNASALQDSMRRLSVSQLNKLYSEVSDQISNYDSVLKPFFTDSLEYNKKHSNNVSSADMSLWLEKNRNVPVEKEFKTEVQQQISSVFTNSGYSLNDKIFKNRITNASKSELEYMKNALAALKDTDKHGTEAMVKQFFNEILQEISKAKNYLREEVKNPELNSINVNIEVLNERLDHVKTGNDLFDLLKLKFLTIPSALTPKTPKESVDLLTKILNLPENITKIGVKKIDSTKTKILSLYKKHMEFSLINFGTF